MEYETCAWCGIITKQSEGPTHRYLESSPGCWAKYGELLVREYQDLRYGSVHGLSVDAYALQHPGQESPQTRSSVFVHLASLYGYFELGKRHEELPALRKQMTARKSEFVWMTPPEDLKAITVADVLASNCANHHCAKVKEWAEYIFRQWGDHHVTVSNLLAKGDC